MKKSHFTFAIIFAFAAVFPLFAKDPTLEQTLADAAAKISKAIDGNVQTVAVLDIRSDHWALSDYIVDGLNHELANALEKTNVAERDDYSLALIQQESDYQLSGAVSDETIQEIGAALGADCIVLGNMETVSGGWQLILRASTVETKKVLASWRGKVSAKEKEVKFQVEKSKKSPKPKYELKSKPTKTSSAPAKNALGVSIEMINENGETVTTLHPRDEIRFRVSADKNAYLAILCIDAHKEETWLPLQSNLIRAGESRIFPDIPGAVLRVEDGIFGNESVTVYAATVEKDLPAQGKMMRTKKFELAMEGAEKAEATVNYQVER